jgi:hypothetical protein
MPSPPLVVANAGQVRILWDINGQAAVNVFGVVVAAGTTFNQSLATSVGTAVRNAFSVHLATLMPATTRVLRIGVRDLRQANQSEFLDGAAPTAGTAVADPLPAGVAICVTIRTALTGKSHRGRSYIGGWSELQNDATGLTASAASAAATAFINATFSATVASGLTLGVLSRPAYHQIVTKTTTVSATDVRTETLFEVDAKGGQILPSTVLEVRNARWEYQRRRDNGRGLAAGALLSVVRQPINV